MKQFEVTVVARKCEFFSAQDEDAALNEAYSWVDSSWNIDDVEVIELDD